MKKLQTFLLLAIVSLLVALYFSFETKVVELDIQKRLQEVATPTLFQNKINKALSTNNLDEALKYKDLANYLDINLSSKTLTKLKAEDNFLKRSWNNTKDFTSGFISSDIHNIASLSGSITSDMILVGDLRDMYKQGSLFTQNKEYDKFTLSLATLGVALSASTYLTLGATAPLKTGTSVIKSANKMNKLSKSFKKLISSKLDKTIDLKLLKKIDYSTLSKMRKSTKTFIKSIDFTHLDKLLHDIGQIKKNSSYLDTINLIQYIDTQKDINRLIKLSSKFKKHSVTILKVVGKTTLRSTKLVIKYSTIFITELLLLVLSFLTFLLTLLLRVFYKSNRS